MKESGVIIPIGIGAAAFSLTLIGAYKAISGDAAAAAGALGFGFLFVVLLLLSKFKRFKGFGFEAETWGEKQNEAAVLIDNLKGLSEAISFQLASLATKVGGWGSYYSIDELAELATQISKMLKASESSAGQVSKALDPIYERMEKLYCQAAFYIVQKGISEKIKNAPLPKKEMTEDLRQELIHSRRELEADQKTLNEKKSTLLGEKNIDAIEKFAATLESVKSDREILSNLAEINRDLIYFSSSRTLRRPAKFAAPE